MKIGALQEKKDGEVVMEAVKQCGSIEQSASVDLKQDKEFDVTAFKNNNRSSKLVPHCVNNEIESEKLLWKQLSCLTYFYITECYDSMIDREVYIRAVFHIFQSI